MSAGGQVFVHGIGAVSPAGWGVEPLRKALAKERPIPPQDLARPGWTRPLRVRAVPPPSPPPAFARHGRLRRSSSLTQYAAASALEALGGDAARATNTDRLGIIVCVMSGCVNYSRRFYDETLKDPATASPLIFPETVFNAPASHVAALLGTTAVSYTLVGDPATFVQGLGLGAEWLLDGRVDDCLVVGVEELDWITADAYRLFTTNAIVSAGAGAVRLGRAPAATGVELQSITTPQLFLCRQSRIEAARRVRENLPAGNAQELLCDGFQNIKRLDDAETAAWQDWPGARVSPKLVLGEALAAASAWQCIAAIDALRQRRFRAATVSVVGCNEQAIAARFRMTESGTPGR